MPSVTYMNQSGPFWDFIANLEQQGQGHPAFSQNREDNNERGEGPPGPPPFGPQSFGPQFSGPWGWGHPAFGGQGIPHRGPPPHHQSSAEQNDEKEKEKEKEKETDNGEGPSNNSGSDNEEQHGRGRHGRCGGRRGRHGFGPYGHHGRGGFGPRHGPPHHGGRGGWGSWGGRGGPFGGGSFDPFNFAAGLFNPTANKEDTNEDYSPDADIFDTPSAFIIHVSLPGAKKEDVGVNWDAEKSELSIAGVVYRPGDEEFLKTLAMDERKIGPFERKIWLGTRANPAQIDAEGITAKLEDGVLTLDVPKLETGFVEIKKVDIE